MPLLPNLIIFDAEEFDPEDIPGSADSYYAFDAMRGNPQPKQQHLEGIVRPGHDGMTVRETGVRGEPSPLETVLYVATRAAALSNIANYTTLIDGNPYEIYINGTSFGFFRILKVINGALPPCANVIGSINATPTIKQIVAFIVESVDPPEEP